MSESSAVKFRFGGMYSNGKYVKVKIKVKEVGKLG